jgi:hypothetical protein
MKKIKPSDLKGFSEGQFTPYTDYSEEIAEWLKENAEFTGRHQSHYDCIFSAGNEFYCHYVKYSHDKYYTNEEFKEWIGMTKKVETVQATTMPELVAGRHYVRFNDGRFGQVMDGYINYVSIGEDVWDIRITSWTQIREDKLKFIVEVFDNIREYSGQYTRLSDFNSGKLTIWKKEDERKQRIEQELEFAKAKAERLATHISILEQKLK